MSETAREIIARQLEVRVGRVETWADAILAALTEAGYDVVQRSPHCLLHENPADCPGGGPCF